MLRVEGEAGADARWRVSLAITFCLCSSTYFSHWNQHYAGSCIYSSYWERLLITSLVGDQGHAISDGSHLKAFPSLTFPCSRMFRKVNDC